MAKSARRKALERAVWNRRRRDHLDDLAFQRRFDIDKQIGRDDFFITSDFSSRVFEPAYRSLPNKINPVVDFDDNYYNSVRSPLFEVEDRRTYNPAGRSFRPAVSSRSHLAKTKIVNPLSTFRNAISAFNYPRKVMICVRRGIRKEIMHALGKSGKGGKHNRKPRYNEHSSVRC